LFEAALELAEEVLKPGGVLRRQSVQAAGRQSCSARFLKKSFCEVRSRKTAGSRAEFVELYLVALGFRPFLRLREGMAAPGGGRSRTIWLIK
jgi:23S rRNA U2552 (ribose-2'-O)-methylase RlmE/FtsJ